jgi:hypothetical protein
MGICDETCNPREPGLSSGMSGVSRRIKAGPCAERQRAAGAEGSPSISSHQPIDDRMTAMMRDQAEGRVHQLLGGGLAAGPALKRYRMKKHFQIEITDTTFTHTRDTATIAAEAALDGFYILRTSLTDTDLTAADVVRAYKNLEQAERALGSLKGPELQIRPIHHRLEDRVKAHVLLCMLAYYLTWHLKAAWKPLLFTDEHRPVSPDPVSKAVRSTTAQHKAQTKRTTTGAPAHSYRTLLAELATQTRNTTRLHGQATSFEKLTQPTPLQAKALDLVAHAPVVIVR